MTYENVIMHKYIKHEIKHFTNERSENATGQSNGMKCSYSNEFITAFLVDVY